LELDNLVLRTTQALMSSNDTASDELAQLAIASLNRVVDFNNDLHVGIDVPDIHSASADIVWLRYECSESTTWLASI
jgi:hypothetical protein